MDEESGQEEVPPYGAPDLGLVRPQPVRLAIGHEAADRLAQPKRAEREAGRAADEWQTGRPALVEPDDRRSQRAAVLVGHDDRAALCRDGHADDGVASRGRVANDLAAGLAERAPVEFGILFRPARMGRDIWLDGDPGAGDEDARGVEDQGSNALCPDVDGEDLLRAARARHDGPSSSRTPRAIRPSGSKVRTIDEIASIPSGPFSAARYGAWSVPTPC